MQISSAPLLTDRTVATPKPAGTYGICCVIHQATRLWNPAGRSSGERPCGMQKAAPLFKRAAF